MYKVVIYSDGEMLEVLEYAFRDEAEATAEAFDNLTDYSVVCDWE